MKFLIEYWNHLKASFKTLSARTLVVILIDILFFFIIIAASNIYINSIQNSWETINSVPIESFNLNSDAVGIENTLNNAFWSMGIVTIAYCVLLLILFSATRYIIWGLIIDKKINRAKLIPKYTVFNVIWGLIWAIPMAFPIMLFALIGKVLIGSPLLNYVLFLMGMIYGLCAYFSLFSGYVFYNNKKILGSALSSFRIGITTLPKLILPLLTAFIFFNLIHIPILYFGSGVYLIIPWTIFMGWFRNYLHLNLKGIPKF